MKVQRNKAIVGQNAFVTKRESISMECFQERTTYEIMPFPADVGYVGQNLVLGKHSGRHAFRDRVISLGFTLDEPAIQRTFDDFIVLADKKKGVWITTSLP